MSADNTDQNNHELTAKGRRLAELLRQGLSIKDAHEIVTREFGYFTAKTQGWVN
jgi:hypothetical protein